MAIMGGIGGAAIMGISGTAGGGSGAAIAGAGVAEEKRSTGGAAGCGGTKVAATEESDGMKAGGGAAAQDRPGSGVGDAGICTGGAGGGATWGAATIGGAISWGDAAATIGGVAWCGIGGNPACGMVIGIGAICGIGGGASFIIGGRGGPENTGAWAKRLLATAAGDSSVSGTRKLGV